MSTPAQSSSSQQSSPAARLLAKQLKEINTANDLMGISVGLLREENVFEWEVSLMINDDCKYYGGACEGPFFASPLLFFPLSVLFLSFIPFLTVSRPFFFVRFSAPEKRCGPWD